MDKTDKKLITAYKSDELSDHSYSPFYLELLKNKRDSIRKVLDLGIGNGSGLMLLREFFPNAGIYGADPRGRLLMRRNRIKSIWCDLEKKEDLVKLVQGIGSDIDLVIDDSSNTPALQVATCTTLMPLIKRGSTYIIEGVRDPRIASSLNNYEVEKPKKGVLVIKHKSVPEMVSILIPSRNESYEPVPGKTVLQLTVDGIYKNATGNFEVLVGFDGPPYQDFPDYPNLKLIKFPDVVGIKTMINALAAMAKGKYIYKTDSHCSFGPSFNEILAADMQEDWLVMPRFYVLNPITWQWQDERFYDYFFLCCPFTDPRGFRFKAGGHWPQRTQERLDTLIDETPQIHGSGWFMSKDYYFNTLGGFPNIDPYGHAQEPIWLALKNWLAGGRVMVNKKTWYAHMHQQANNRGYHMDNRQTQISYDLAANYWVGNKWAERKHDFEWFVDKFSPMPTWPDNWKELYKDWLKKQK